MTAEKFKEEAAKVLKIGNQYAVALEEWQRQLENIPLYEFQKLQAEHPELAKIEEDMRKLGNRLDI